MKKTIIALTLVMALCLSLVTTAFAAELDQTNTSGDSIVYYKIGNVTNGNDPDNPTDDEVGGTYKVSIPEYIEAVSADQSPTTQNVTAKDVLIPYGTTLTVGVTYDGNLKLKNNESVTVPYDLQASGSNISSGDTILTVSAGTPTAETSTPIGAKLTASPIYSGTYSNTVSFAIALS